MEWSNPAVDGTEDLERAIGILAERLPPPLRPLAQLAYNYWWSWTPSVESLFERVDSERWERCGHNPLRVLQEVDPWELTRWANDATFVHDVHLRSEELHAYLRSRVTQQAGRPRVAYMCAEFGIHRSLPFYAGGLGVLAGDFLKEASDEGLPVVGVGLFYSQGSFHQRLDESGWQHEFWQATDSDRLPAVLVSGSDGPLTVEVCTRGRAVSAQVWRVDVGASRLYLLDTNRPGNGAADRWITARLYVGDREMRLAQYALLGIGGMRALRAMGLDPDLVHLNEGHASLATLERLREHLQSGEGLVSAIEAVRRQTVFTTHTPVKAGNESFSIDGLRAVLPDLAEQVGVSWDDLLGLARVRPSDTEEGFGLTPLALRLSGEANGVSELHGCTARAMWAAIWPGRSEDDVPIRHVTNGVHLPTWMAVEWQTLFDTYLPGWRRAAPDAPVWDKIAHIPDEEIWAARGKLRARLTEVVRSRSVPERLGRGERVAYAESAVNAWHPDALTLGFARRIATYKRLYLLTSQPKRAVRLLAGTPPLQVVFAGRAHPQDEPAKQTVQQLFAINDLPGVGGRAVFLEEYDLELARQLVQGCDLWINLPRRPLEASGTSGMKSAVNGGLQISVLDGWWAEGHGAESGWSIPADAALSPEEQDRVDSGLMFDILEYEVLPAFFERDERGVPVRWIDRIRAGFRALLPRYSASRMVREYEARMYRR